MILLNIRSIKVKILLVPLFYVIGRLFVETGGLRTVCDSSTRTPVRGDRHGRRHGSDLFQPPFLYEVYGNLNKSVTASFIQTQRVDHRSNANGPSSSQVLGVIFQPSKGFGYERDSTFRPPPLVTSFLTRETYRVPLPRVSPFCLCCGESNETGYSKFHEDTP